MRHLQLAGIVLFTFMFTTQVNAQSVDYAEIGERGIQAFSKGNLIQALDLLDQAAQHDYAPAQSTLAYILDKADDDERAFKLFQQAADQNYAAAQYGLAGMYAKGEGVEKNLKLAGEWMQKSAMQSYTLAMRDFATALEKGELGLDPDINQAVHWFNKCNEAGDVVCKRRLAKAYAMGELGLAVDEPKAKQLMRELNSKKEVK